MENLRRSEENNIIISEKNQSIYVDITVGDEKTHTENELSSENLQVDDFLSDEFDWDDKLLDSLFEDNSQVLKSTINDSRNNVENDAIPKLEIKSSSTTKKDSNKSKSSKVLPIIEETKSIQVVETEEVSEEVQERRTYWREARKIYLKRRLIVPPNDQRRNYLKLLALYFNSHQIHKLHDHFNQNAEGENFVFRQNVQQLREDGLLLFYFMPKVMEIKGVDNYMKYCKTLITCAPDLTTSFSNIIIRNKINSSVIMADIVIEGTPTFHILVKNIVRSAITPSKNNEEMMKKKRKYSKNEILDEVVITDLSSSIEKMEISDDSSSNSKVEISQGRIRNIKEISPYRGHGVIRCHLGKDKKCYLAEVDILRIERVGEESVEGGEGSLPTNKPTSSLSVYRWASHIGKNMSNFLQFKPKNDD